MRTAVLSGWTVPVVWGRIGEHGVLGLEDVQDRESTQGAQPGRHFSRMATARDGSSFPSSLPPFRSAPVIGVLTRVAE